MKTNFNIAACGAIVVVFTACGDDGGAMPQPDGPTSVQTLASDVPIDGLSHDDALAFFDGDSLFDLPFRPADGLGPLYVRSSCGACHSEGSRGPGLVQKMAIVLPDGVTPDPDQSALAYGHTIRESLAAGATTPIEAPTGVANVKTTIRMGPPVLGRGYLEAIADSEIERVAMEQTASGGPVHGVINRVTFHSVPNPDATFGTFVTGQTYIGRFGVKSRQPSLDDFAADAFQGDMGLTTPMRPTELPNPDGLTDDLRTGVDLDQGHVDRVAFYMRRIAIPKRPNATAEGATAFAGATCTSCHVPSLHTRADYPIAQLADIDAPVFTDMLLHDMGPALADGLTDETATSPGWRTAPLIGLRFSKVYLHDGRAGSIEEAILAHDGEAKSAADLYRAMSPADQQTLLHYVESL